MGSRHRVIAVLFVALTGCQDDPVGALTPSGWQGVPVDTYEPGELVEGDEQAFGLPLPRDMRVVVRMDDTVVASGKVAFEAASNYVRDRVHTGRVETGPTRSVFHQAVLKRDDTKTVLVEVRRKGIGVELVVRNKTRKPAEPGLSDAERWRRAGLTPDGQVIEKTAE